MALFHNSSFLDGLKLCIVTVDWCPIKKRFPCLGVFSKNICMQENAYSFSLPKELNIIKGN
jgi:hypothetical protein